MNDRTCPRCNGMGTSGVELNLDPVSTSVTATPCPICSGTGHLSTLPCGHPVEAYRRIDQRGSSCAWCLDVMTARHDAYVSGRQSAVHQAVELLLKAMREELDHSSSGYGTPEYRNLHASRADLIEQLANLIGGIRP